MYLQRLFESCKEMARDECARTLTPDDPISGDGKKPRSGRKGGEKIMQMLAPISFHARTRKYDRLCGWYEWSVSSVHFDLLGVPLTVESLDSADDSYSINEAFAPVCSMDGAGRIGVVLRLNYPRREDEVSAIEIAIMDEDLVPLIERLVKLSIERGETGRWPLPASCGAFDVAEPTSGVWTGEDDIMSSFADDAQHAKLEEAQSLLLAAWDEGIANLMPPMDPTPPVVEPVIEAVEMNDESSVEPVDP